MENWEPVWSAVVIFVIVTIVGGLLATLRRWFLRAFARRPSFVLRRGAGGSWVLVRTRRRPAFDVGVGKSGLAGSSLGAVLNELAARYNDMRHRDEMVVGSDGSALWFSWVEGGRRYVSRSIELNDGISTIDVVGRPVRDPQHPISTY